MMFSKLRAFFSMLILLTAFIPFGLFAATETPGEAQGFASPDEAMKALVDVARDYDEGKVSMLFGSQYAELFSSGDDVEDANNREDFLKMAEEKSSVETEGESKAILHFGQQEWPFPIPLIKKGDQWQFDAAQGKEEIINRRIGRNELNTLGVMRGYVEAQFQYASIDRDADEVSEFATKFRSEPGKFDGLYWESEAGQTESPLGPLVAEARAEGYKLKDKKNAMTPYHGYYYKILTRQGAHAPGGKYDYIINGNMIAGFALVAFPAEYGSSGIMTFIVNHQGKIHQKNLGPKTAELALAMKTYDPDSTWEVVNQNSGQ